MKMLYYFGVFVIMFANIPSSYSSYNARLEAQIKPNPTNGSKPTTSFLLGSSVDNNAEELKLASVHFLPGGHNFKLKFKCPYGWYFSQGKCEPNPCNGFPYYNRYQLENCVSYESCRSGDTMKYRCTSCPANMTKSNGACICSPTEYPKSLENGCMYEFDNANKCTEVRSDGFHYETYAGCLCPSSWQKCDGAHQEGQGSPCDSYGEISYYNCGCVSAYNKSCVNGAPVNPHDFCLNLTDGNRYYDECYFCDINEGKVFDYSDYWCEQEWVNFPPLPNPEDLFLEREPQDCSAYTLAASECDPAAGECSYCYGNGLWKYDSCFDGWYMNGKVCTENACEGFNSLTASISGCMATSSCKQGDTNKYACTSCGEDYTLTAGVCEYTCQYYVDYLSTGCKTMDSCQRGGKTYYSNKCTECYTGYDLSGNSCNMTCSYTSTSKENCVDYEECKRGSAEGLASYYHCSECREGYYLSPYDTTCISCEEGKTGARTEEPYEDRDCQRLFEMANGTAAETSCGGKTYYYCVDVDENGSTTGGTGESSGGSSGNGTGTSGTGGSTGTTGSATGN